MPGYGVERDDAVREIAEVENALFDGYRAIPQANTGEKGAIRVASERLGMSDQTLRRRIGRPDVVNAAAHFRHHGLSVDWSMYQDRVHNQGEIPKVNDRKHVLLQDEVRRLTAALKQAHRASNEEEIIREIVGRVANMPRETPAWAVQPPERSKHKPTPEVPVTIWSDWHLGEVVERAEMNGFNEFNLKIAEERVERLVESTIKICRHNHVGVYPGIVVNILGDMVSGGIHPELAKTDEEEGIPASLKASDWLISALSRFADEFKRVYVPFAAGNHGRLTPKPELKRYLRKNWDWLIIQIVARHFADDKRIVFDIRPSNDVHYRVFNERYVSAHGDMLGVRGGDGIIGSLGPIARGEIKQSGQSSALGLGFDKLLIGHWHQRLWLPRAIVNNCLKGFDQYAMKALGAKPDRPTQALFFVHPRNGQTASWDIYVDGLMGPVADWVSWKPPIAA